ncbi:YaeQ family protein [Catenovulum maritimum]|uniref:YaeQ family protein n=1 Tax=Catenovulum maritimum TaxID=1513271 RepID=A0A0J8H022_9ALTE|nr:YaeQ family protein [Catenovulum maritimum]KMT66353.1 hypothetical protein XM47_03720 [Catenovulum maritimum]
MADGSFIIKAELNISHVDTHEYFNLNQVLATKSSESSDHLVQRILALALFKHQNLEFNQNDFLAGEPDLFVKRNQAHYEHWIGVDGFLPEQLEKAEAKSEHVWLFYHDTDKASKLLKSINKHPRLQLIQYSPELITQLSQCIQKQIKWSVMIDGDLLTVAADDLFVESEIHQYHPLTVPKLDFIH